MSEPDALATETPDPPWRPQGDPDSRPRRGAFRRLSERTPLRTKLIASVLALVAMALAAIMVVSFVIVQSDLYTQRDRQLEGVFGTLQSDFQSAGRDPLVKQLNTAFSAGGSGIIVGVQQLKSQLSPYSQSNSYPGFSNSYSKQAVPELPTGQWASSSKSELIIADGQSSSDTWRVIGQAVPVTSPTTGNVVTAFMFAAVDLGPVGAEIQRLILVELLVGIAIVIVLAIVGIGVVRANLRPLNDIELTAGQIAKGHLDHRVPEGDPRTEIGSLGRSLNTMLSQIERAFHAQEESEQAAHESEERMRRFIADASHELRTPLTTIRGFAAHYRMRGGAGGRRVGVGVGVGGGAAVSGAGAGRTGAGGPAVGGAAVGGAGFGRGADEQSSRTEALVPGSADGVLLSGPTDDGMSPADLDHLIGRVEAEATRMGLLVEDLLTLARLDQQRPLNIAPVDLLTLAADAVQDARIVSPDRSIDLIVAPGTAFLVDGDEPRLRQVLANLVNNAITHTPAGTPVRVKIASGMLEGGRPDAVPAVAVPAVAVPAIAVPAVVLDVEDDGQGMPAEQAQRVFERFYRADAARNRASGGTGLGLAIVAGLVNAHGGSVSVRTAPGRGADFQVRLPLSPDALLDSDDPDDPLSD
jgi:two-component system, OmpR family, sensor kinase